jgi:hypothetical protein
LILFFNSNYLIMPIRAIARTKRGGTSVLQELEKEVEMISEAEKRTGIPKEELIRLIWQTVQDRLGHSPEHI